jgi:anthranilate synthase component 2
MRKALLEDQEGFSSFGQHVYSSTMILVVDNYDSFTYNLVQLLEKILRGTPEHVLVRRNDQITIDEIAKLKPARILISPGPGRPEHAGISVDTIRTFGETIPILGVCLGHQAIGAAFGGTIVEAPTLMHGMTSEVFHTNISVFRGVKNPVVATRYHSLIVEAESLPASLEVTARTSDGVVMGLRHTTFPIDGVQFHPEAILTEEGERMLCNWIAQ